MKTVLQIFSMLLLFMGLELEHQLTPAVPEDSQELWNGNPWEEAAMETQEEDENDMLLLDSMEPPLTEVILKEDEVMDEEEAVAEELIQEEDVTYLKQAQFNMDCNVMMAQKAQNPRSMCKVKHTFIHENLDKVKAICPSPSIPCKKDNKCHQSSDPLKLTICQLTGDTVFPNKCHYQSTPLTVTITIACDGIDPESFNY
ncbi:ribonuclease pancreatic-like [Notamacropus eugenii]|uniref:ribonuclease pancreatic-like n=1 Tax=Notamacropus eugenii TaxID=9315 RepID=UPI003B6839AE